MLFIKNVFCSRQYVKGPTNKNLIFLIGDSENYWVQMYEFNTNTFSHISLEGLGMYIPITNVNTAGGILATGTFNVTWISGR